MGLHNRYVVLYFMNGPNPSQNQLDEARHYGPNVMFRNARYIGEKEGCEPCTAVAGEVPKQYARKFPAAVTYAEWLNGGLGVAPDDLPPPPSPLDGLVLTRGGPAAVPGADPAFQAPPPPPGEEAPPPPPAGAKGAKAGKPANWTPQG